MNNVEKAVAGVVAIGLVTAIGLHAAGLAMFSSQVIKSAGQIEGTAING